MKAKAGPLSDTSIIYAQTATNNGPDTLASGTVTATLPAQTTGVTGLPAGCTYNNTDKTVACTHTNIASGTSVVNTFTAKLGLLSVGPLPASSTRTTSSPTDPNTANDTATAESAAPSQTKLTRPATARSADPAVAGRRASTRSTTASAMRSSAGSTASRDTVLSPRDMTSSPSATRRPCWSRRSTSGCDRPDGSPRERPHVAIRLDVVNGFARCGEAISSKGC
uniref:DUF11 domain-containing protein n=1 Tax=Streptomyces anulatus TaxID=1892 RepID=UPI001C5DFEA1